MLWLKDISSRCHIIEMKWGVVSRAKKNLELGRKEMCRLAQCQVGESIAGDLNCFASDDLTLISGFSGLGLSPGAEFPTVVAYLKTAQLTDSDAVCQAFVRMHALTS